MLELSLLSDIYEMLKNLSPGERRWYIKALEEDRTGLFCHNCDSLNDQWDDCGWWYGEVEGSKKIVPQCSHCLPASSFNGER